MNKQEIVGNEQPDPDAGAYEAPLVERVVTTEQLAREVQYAGVQSGPDFG
jgi:hypothetical protein